MKKLLKHMSKVLSMFLLFCSIGMQPSEYSQELTQMFIQGIDGWRQGEALRILNNPRINSRIDVNASDKHRWTALMLACRFGHLELVEKLLELKKPDGSLLVDVNAKGGTFLGYTALMYACHRRHQKIVEKLLELKESDGSLLVDINARNSWNETAFMIACDERHLGIIESLLAYEADTTMFPGPGHVRYYVKTLRDLRESPGKKNILLVFDALKSGIKDAQRTFLEASIVEAYEQFLRGNHTELRNLLLVAPDAVERRISDGKKERKRCVGYRDALMRSMRSVFKKESIKPLLYFLAEKKYQRNMAEVLVDMIKSDLEDNCPADHPETVDMVKSVHRLPIEDCSLRE